MEKRDFIEAFKNCDEETKHKIECILNNSQDKQSSEDMSALSSINYQKEA